jgi:HSP20 family protein
MADVTIKKGEKGQGQEESRAGSGKTPAVSRSGEGGLSRRSPASLFSLTPRDFFAASPFELMRRFTDDMDRFFETGSSGSSGWGSSMMWSPPIEISEKDGQLTVCAELPGLSKDDVKVELTQDGLTISGERKREQEQQRGGMYRSERTYGSFMRTIPIPEDAQMDSAKATFENGVLTISIPVQESQQRRREIPIESGGGPPEARKQAA